MPNKFTKAVMGSMALALLAGTTAFAGAPQAKNLIVFVVDGFGVGDLAAVKPNLGKLLSGGNLLMAAPPQADTAAAMTAFSTGLTTDPGMVSIAPDRSLAGYESIVTRVIPEKGTKAAGLVTTGKVTDPSVAVFYGHSTDAGAVDFLASQAAVSGYDVVLGGGKEAFTTKAQGGLREDDDEIWTGLGEAFKVVETPADLGLVTDPKAKVLGLFKGTARPTVAAMTGMAIKQLSDTPSGFALVVNEAGLDRARNAKVDDSTRKDLDDAIGVALEFAASTPDTLVLVTGTTGVEAIPVKGLLGTTKVEYGYTTVPVPVVAGGSSAAASTFKGYMNTTAVFGLMKQALGL